MHSRRLAFGLFACCKRKAHSDSADQNQERLSLFSFLMHGFSAKISDLSHSGQVFLKLRVAHFTVAQLTLQKGVIGRHIKMAMT